MKDIKSKKVNIGKLLQLTFSEFISDNAIKLSAALSYYTIFSLPALLIIIINLCGLFFGEDAVRGELFGQINGLVGNDVALQIQDIIKNIKLSKENNAAAIIGGVVLLIGASGVFSEIQDSINFIWGIKARPKKGFLKFIRNRLMSFSMIGSVGFLLLVGLIVNSLMDVLSNRLITFFPEDIIYLLYAVNLIIVFLIITLLFVVIFKALPDGKVVLRDCFVGAAFTSVLFMLGKFAIGAYLGSTAMASIYGAAGSLILILAWVYYSAIILYFGAEFTKVYSIMHGDNIVPNEYAVKFSKSAFNFHESPQEIMKE
jgi:membrane protein